MGLSKLGPVGFLFALNITVMGRGPHFLGINKVFF